uniref:Uncharacterized protein n=1 Tax=Parascaris univalens TaxID=6257 RepID=A0A915A4W3_PARUN
MWRDNLKLINVTPSPLLPNRSEVEKSMVTETTETPMEPQIVTSLRLAQRCRETRPLQRQLSLRNTSKSATVHPQRFAHAMYLSRALLKASLMHVQRVTLQRIRQC